MNIITFVILLCLFTTVAKILLNRRNINYINNHSHKVPEFFKDSISLEEHLKSARYTTTKLNFSNFTLILKLASFVLTLTFILPAVDSLVTHKSENSIIQGLLFFALFSVIDSLISIPLSLYSNFVIEERFGFNKMTYKLFVSDLAKQTILSALLMTPILAAVIYFISEFKTTWWLWAWLLFTSFQLLLLWLYPQFIAPLFNKFSPLDDKEVLTKIRSLIKRCGLEFGEIFVMNASLRSSHGNAYFTGFGKKKRIVFFDNILNQLSPNEVEAVMAHELGHYKHKHIQQMLIKFIIISFILSFLCGYIGKYDFFYDAFNVSKSSHSLLFLFSLILPLFLFWVTPLSSYFSRKNEYQADKFAVTYSRGEDLISALISLYKKNSNFLLPEPIYSKFYYSHPPAVERIKYIESQIKESLKN